MTTDIDIPPRTAVRVSRRRNGPQNRGTALVACPPGSVYRDLAETMIRDRFRTCHNATVESFLPSLVGIVDDNDRLRSVVGYRGASGERLFLEQYLSVPVETAISLRAGQPVSREAVVEIGNLATNGGDDARALFGLLALHLQALGFCWAVFTATQTVSRMFRQLRVPLLKLAAADPRRLGASARSWGDYYRASPTVSAGHIPSGIDRVTGAIARPGLPS